MLNGISNDKNEAIKNSSISQVSSLGVSNPYKTKDMGLFIDESDISQTAIKMYEREMDVKKFTKLALSDPEDDSANKLVVSKVMSGCISIDDDEAIFSLLSNEDFLNEIAS